MAGQSVLKGHKKSKKQDAKNTKTVADLRTMSVDELQKLLETSKKDLLELQKSLKANELANPHAVKKMRREIARIKTVMAEVIASEAKQSSDNNLGRHVPHQIGGETRDDKKSNSNERKENE